MNLSSLDFYQRRRKHWCRICWTNVHPSSQLKFEAWFYIKKPDAIWQLDLMYSALIIACLAFEMSPIVTSSIVQTASANILRNASPRFCQERRHAPSHLRRMSGILSKFLTKYSLFVLQSFISLIYKFVTQGAHFVKYTIDSWLVPSFYK